MTLQVDLVSGAFWHNGPVGSSIEVRGLDGREAIAELYELRLMLQRAEPFSAAEIDRLLDEPCAVRFTDPDAPTPESVMHGILSSLERIDGSGGAGAFYHAVLTPRAALLLHNRCSRLYTNVTLAEILQIRLGDFGLASHANGDVVLHLGAPRALDYAVQFEESDWAFLQRWLEQEGYSYWFEQRDDGEALVVCDGIEAIRPAQRPLEAVYSNANLLTNATGHENVLYDWNRRHQRTTQRVALVDYDPIGGRGGKSPEARWLLQSMEIPDAKLGSGATGAFRLGGAGSEARLACLAGSPVVLGASGEVEGPAARHADAIASTRVIYAAKTQSRRLHAGSVFELHGDPSLDANAAGSYNASEDAGGRYLVTSVVHRYGVPVTHDVATFAEQSRHYVAELTAVRIDGAPTFRPARRAPWPRIDGVLIGHVMGLTGQDQDAEQTLPAIDEHGRYRVRLPFAARDNEQAFGWVRMAQGAAGAGHGIHQPLHPGTEVLLAHVGGNPDRPFIVGAVPNAATQSPVTGAHPAQTRLVSAGGVAVELDDYTEVVQRPAAAEPARGGRHQHQGSGRTEP